MASVRVADLQSRPVEFLGLYRQSPKTGKLRLASG